MRSILILVISVGILCLGPQPSFSFSISESLALALETNPRARIAYSQIIKSQADLREKKSDYYPDVDLTLARGWNQVETQEFINQGIGPQSRSDRYEQRLKITIPIFDATLPAAVRRERYQLSGRISKSRAALNSLALDAGLSHLEVVRISEIGKLIDEQTSLLSEFIEVVKDKERSGVATSLDVGRAENALNALEAQKQVNTVELLLSAAQYEVLVGQSPTNLEEPELPISYLPASVEDARTLAGKINEEISSTKNDFLAARADVDFNRGKYLPNLSMELEASKTGNADGTAGVTTDFRAMLFLRWKLFDGFKTGAQVIAARSEVIEQAARYDLEKLEVNDRVRTNFLLIKQQKVSLDVAGKSADQAEENFFRYLDEYELGEREIQDLIDSARTTFSSKVAVIDNRIRMKKSAFRLLGEIGILIPSTDNSILNIDGEDALQSFDLLTGSRLFNSDKITKEKSIVE